MANELTESERLRLDMYQPVALENRDHPTWGDIYRLARQDATVRHYATLAERGDMTRDRALIAMAFALYEEKRRMFHAEVERRACEVPDFIITADGKRYDRRL